jgi:transposase-like protein
MDESVAPAPAREIWSLVELARRYRGGASLAQLAKAQGIAESTMHMRLVRAGCAQLMATRRGGRGTPRGEYKLTDAQMVERYREGLSIVAVADEAQCSRETVYRRLLAAGLHDLLAARRGKPTKGVIRAVRLPQDELARLRRYVGLPEVLPSDYRYEDDEEASA